MITQYLLPSVMTAGSRIDSSEYSKYSDLMLLQKGILHVDLGYNYQFNFRDGYVQCSGIINMCKLNASGCRACF